MTNKEKFEAGFTLLAILALWPVILGWENPIYQVILSVFLVVFVVLVVQKIRRIRSMYKESMVEAKNRKTLESKDD